MNVDLQVTGDYASQQYNLPGNDSQIPDIPPPEVDERTPLSAFTQHPHDNTPQTQDEIEAQLRKDKDNVYK